MGRFLQASGDAAGSKTPSESQPGLNTSASSSRALWLPGAGNEQ